MPKKAFEPKREVIKYLQSQLVAVVATIAPDGRPQAATVFFWVNDLDAKDAPFHLYFISRRHTRKFENLVSNKKAAVVVGTELAPTSVQIEGRVEIVDLGDTLGEMVELKERLKRQPTMARIYDGAFFPKSPFSKLGTDFVVYRVIPDWVRWMRLDKASKGIVYDQIMM